MSVVRGCDVSAIQGRLPADAMAALGLSFAFVRCQVGNQQARDVLFEDDVSRLKQVGIRVAPYCFAYPLPHLDPLDQADHFRGAAMVGADLVGNRVGDLPPALDLEWPPPEQWAARGCTAEQIVDWALRCVDGMRARWTCDPVLYSYPWFLKNLSAAPLFATLAASCRLWIAGGAQYMNGDGHVPDLAREQPPRVPGWGGDWTFWQHDGDGGARLPNGVDADFNVFNGDLAALDRLCGAAQTTPSASEVTAAAAIAREEDMALIVEDALHDARQERAAGIVAGATA